MGKKSASNDESKKKSTRTTKKEKVEITEKIDNTKVHRGLYLGYNIRLVTSIILFVVFFLCGLFFMLRSFSFKSGESINYQEKSNLDYRVYLKANNFYEQDYLGKDMLYVASLIDHIDVDFNYNFMIDRNTDIDFTYDIIGKLVIADANGKSVFFEKEYTLLDSAKESIAKNSVYDLKKSISIDYPYYNSLANQFRINYGIDTTSNLTIYFRINQNNDKAKESFMLNNDSTMSVTIPLSEKAVDIKLDYKEVNDNKQLLNNSVVMVSNYVYIVLGILSILGALFSIVRLLRLVGYSIVKKSNYDKYISKLLKEYDRLIIETTSPPLLKDHSIIKIDKFQELLDARDNLKLPIKYYVVSKHQKCYFFITHEDEIYLLTIKAIDMEEQAHEK